MKLKFYLKVFTVVILIFSFLLCKRVYDWSPYFKFININNYKHVLKVAHTIIFSSPQSFSNHRYIDKLNGQFHISADPNHFYYKKLLKHYPLPKMVAESKNNHKKIEEIRNFVFDILPKKSDLPQHPEPESALTLLGSNPQKTPYPRLCSKLAKIFSSYLSAYNIKNRIVQVHNHILNEVWNSHRKKWEVEDAYFNSDVLIKGKKSSAAAAYKALINKETIVYKGPKSVFKTVVTIPRSNFEAGNLSKLHYFSYDNLAYWEVKKVSPDSDKFWQDKNINYSSQL